MLCINLTYKKIVLKRALLINEYLVRKLTGGTQTKGFSELTEQRQRLLRERESLVMQVESLSFAG
jgi:molybdenum-dependent DNA-binding transcriptional regulator ModE